MDAISPDVAKLLTHVEASVRTKAVGEIKGYLVSRERAVGDVDDVELQKLWKALYYCFWLTDKQSNQQEMSAVLAELGTHSFSKERNVHRYFVNFFIVLRHEWTKIDYLRIDKYYALVRRMLAEWFFFLKSTQWRMSSLEAFSEMLRDEVLLPFQADGLRLHLSFIYLTELAKAGGCQCDDTTVRELLSPFFCVLVQPPSEVMFQRTVKEVFESLDEEFGAAGDRFTTLDRYSFGRALFEIAQDVDTLKPSHRKQLYALASKTFGYSSKKRSEAAATVAPVAVVSKKAKAAAAKEAEEEQLPESEAEEEELPKTPTVPVKKQVRGKLVNLPKKTMTAEDMEEEKYEPKDEVATTPVAASKKPKHKNATPKPAVAAAVPVAAAAPTAAAETEPAAAALPKKKVSFSHFETQGIKQITKRMQDTPKKPAAEFAKPAKSLLRASKWPATSSASSKKPKA